MAILLTYRMLTNYGHVLLISLPPHVEVVPGAISFLRVYPAVSRTNGAGSELLASKKCSTLAFLCFNDKRVDSLGLTFLHLSLPATGPIIKNMNTTKRLQP